MSRLTINRDWFEPDYVPKTLYEGVLGEPHAPAFADVLAAADSVQPDSSSLEAFALSLVSSLWHQISVIEGPVHCLLSGGYDSRMLAHMLERADKRPLYITDGAEEPACTATLDYLHVPHARRYLHNMTRHDPYGLVGATCEGFAPLYTQLRFMPKADITRTATLVTGLGGGEWFSYPASGWHFGKQRRIEHSSVLRMWMDCWPQYTLIPGAWGRDYKAMLNPYCTPSYGMRAARCRDEWLVELGTHPELDAVRGAMIERIDPKLAGLGYAYHYYDWNLREDDCAKIDMRYLDSTVGRFHRAEWGLPHEMDKANHACTMAGLATWVDQLETKGFHVE